VLAPGPLLHQQIGVVACFSSLGSGCAQSIILDWLGAVHTPSMVYYLGLYLSPPSVHAQSSLSSVPPALPVPVPVSLVVNRHPMATQGKVGF